uniref:Secreted protein n=1 Tax=Haemonchus placei TaxID=6290 RepID=A0A0N4X9Q9_HAEPC
LWLDPLLPPQLLPQMALQMHNKPPCLLLQLLLQCHSPPPFQFASLRSEECAPSDSPALLAASPPPRLPSKGTMTASCVNSLSSFLKSSKDEFGSLHRSLVEQAQIN